MKSTLLHGFTFAAALFVLYACDDNNDQCASDQDCESDEICNSGSCESQSSGNRDTGRPRDVESIDAVDSAAIDTQPETVATDLSAEPVEDADSGGGAETTPEVSIDESPDIAGLLSTECLGFCTALCDFLWECGKQDTTCVTRCAQSPRYQQLSAAACTEGADAIGIEEDCSLWTSCGGSECAIDEMCLLGLGYQCVLICDQNQTEPSCPSGSICFGVDDANGSRLQSLGMCVGF